ncbi:uncharacterized protein PFL1_04330 [Pseudozyma flocculosa PF-1]|uniref:histidine kinase n=1 Tax=Pseudozyma flocculosa PF-1 TaxID=1277687 RepID=A0A061H5Y3_9BASI|nr:uncharacterized protein PFL1_04330 [Pseudozyma flocculosa PF-1]EPQ28003.1 hypothetical protein PFL1_04330 [Pseudozyma flocculosa PF-1]
MYADTIAGRRPGPPSSASTSSHPGSGSVMGHDAASRSTTNPATSTSAGNSAQLLSHPTRPNALDIDDGSSVGSNDALHHRVQLKSALSSPRSSVSGSGPARRGAWRAMGGGKSSRSYAATPKSSSDLSPSSSSQGQQGTREASPEADDAFAMGIEALGADFDLDEDGDIDEDDGGDDRTTAIGTATRPDRGQPSAQPAWDKLRQHGLPPPGGIAYLPALSMPAAAAEEETASASTESKSISTPSSSAEAVPTARLGVGELPTQPAGAYDWANFVYAYARGRWNPGATPQPPDQSTIYTGASVKIVDPGQPQNGKVPDRSTSTLRGPQPRRPSLEYVMPLSSENVEAVSGGLLPALEPRSLPNDQQQWSDGGVQGGTKMSPGPSEKSIESLPERMTMPSLRSMSSTDFARQQHAQLIAAMRNPSNSTSAVAQVPAAHMPPDASGDHAPVRAQTAPQGGSLTGKTGHQAGIKADESTKPDASIWDTPKLKKGISTPPETYKQADRPRLMAADKALSSIVAPHQMPSRPSLGTQISHLMLDTEPSATDGRTAGEIGSTGLNSAASATWLQKEQQHHQQQQQPPPPSRVQPEDPTTPTRPGPTPVQRGPGDASPPVTWQSAPDGLSGMAEAMARQASSTAPADGTVYTADAGPEHGTVAGLRRAARRTSIERGGEGGSERKPTAEHLRKGGHSASFPGTSRSSPLSSNGPDGLPVVPHLSSIGSVSSVTATASGSGSAHSMGPPVADNTSPVISVAHFAEGKPTGETRIDLRGNVSSPPNMVQSLAKEGTESSSGLRRENSVATASRGRPQLGSKTTSQRINAYLAAGRRAEKFYNDHGYLPFVLPPNESHRLQALSRYGPPKIAGDPNFERIAHLVKLVFNSKLVLITLVGENEQTFQTEMGGGGEVTIASLQSMAGSRNCSFCSHAILQDGDEPMVILDATRDWRFAGNPLVRGSPDIRFYAGCPLRTPDGHNIGSLCLIDDRPRAEFGPRQRHTLKEFARVVMREMELLREKINLGMRDRMQKSIELFTKECLEMDSEDGDGDSGSGSAGTHRVFEQAADSIRNALQASGAVIFDLSHFELIDTYESELSPAAEFGGGQGGASTASKVYFSNPVRPSLAASERGDSDRAPAKKGHQRNHSAGIDGTTGFETFSPLASPSDESVRDKVVPPMSVLGASEAVAPPAERLDSVPLAHHVKVAEFLRLNKTGRFYPFAPPPFRSLLPSGVTDLLLVPIFGLNKQPFALLCAYSTASESGHSLEEIKGIGLQYLRAIGMIVLSAVLKKDIMLADRAKSHFISNISHELRTPLHGILAAAELLTETELNATQGSYLETVEACGKSLLELVNHVLDFTKLSGNSRQGQKHVYTKTKCDMVKLIQEVCESSWIGQMAKQLESAQSGIGSVYAPPSDDSRALAAPGTAASNVQARARHAKNSQVETVIDISLRPDGWLVNCDTGGIRRVLMNLIGNSLKFTASGYVHVSLREVQSSDTHVLIELGVIDTGRGISRAFLEEQLFHPFTQENPHGTGTGLGLSIVNSIVQSPALNGKIDVWSTEGQGTEIRVTCELELCDDEDAEGPIYKPAINVRKRRSVALLGFGNSRGDEDLRAAIEGYFYNWWEFTVVEQDDPRGFRYGDVVLINDDLAAIERIRRERRGDLPPVMFLTGGRGDAEITAACEAYHAAGGVARILFKPAGPSKLESVVDFCLQCLDRQRSGDPPSSEETKPSTPLPSPSQSPAARANVENGDTYFFPANSRSDTRPALTQGFQSFESGASELTPKAETSPSSGAAQAEATTPSAAAATTLLDADRLAAPEPYHMSPGPPGPSTSLIRRHSTEDKVVRQKIEGTDTCADTGAVGCSKPSRPLLPARSITYHEPRLHKHVLMSPMGGPSSCKRSGGADGPDGSSGGPSSYFDHSPGPSSPNTPGSTISLEGGDGAVLRSVVSSSAPRSVSGGSSGSSAGHAAPKQRRLQILSVEDNAINRKVIAAFLAKLDVDYVEACNGEEGVKQFEMHPPHHFDVVLMDLSMPVLDGEFPARASRPTARNRVKIFALTGRSTDEDKRRAFQTGADGYIVKPLSFKVLSSLLRMLPR